MKAQTATTAINGKTATQTATATAAIASKEIYNLAQKAKALKAKIEQIKNELEVAEKEIKKAFELDEFTIAEELRTASGRLVATWKEIVSFPIDTKKLEAELPEIANKYRTMRSYRRFCLK